MSSKPVSAAAVRCCCLLLLLLAPAAVAVAFAARLLEQLKVSDRQMILKLCMLVCARVFGCGSER